MMSAFVSILFVGAFCLAMAAIATTWRAYGTELLTLRQQRAACDPVRELRFVTITTLVRLEGADLWRPGFRPLAAQIHARRGQYRQVRQPELRPELRHAAA